MHIYVCPAGIIGVLKVWKRLKFWVFPKRHNDFIGDSETSCSSTHKQNPNSAQASIEGTIPISRNRNAHQKVTVPETRLLFNLRLNPKFQERKELGQFPISHFIGLPILFTFPFKRLSARKAHFPQSEIILECGKVEVSHKQNRKLN